MRIVVFTDNGRQCKQLKEWLVRQNVAFREVLGSSLSSAELRALGRESGQSMGTAVGFPVVSITASHGDTWVTNQGRETADRMIGDIREVLGI